VRHEWVFVCSRPTLDPTTVAATYHCYRCGSSYNMEVPRSRQFSQATAEAPSWKGVDPDCDVSIVSGVMSG